MKQEKYNVIIIVAAHKKYKMPDDKMYLPLQVGAEGKEGIGFQKDNTGDNISELNPSFCELTGLYWAWKNLDTDYLGLVHYRRYFSLNKKKVKSAFDKVLTYDDIKPFVGKIKVFVPRKRKYYIETLYSHYKHTHYIEQLDKTREIIADTYVEYIESFDKVVNKTSGYMFNVMIMEKELLNEYCTWLFDILFKLKEQIDMPELSSFQGRFYGRVSEIIFNVWLDYQISDGRIKRDEIKEISCIYMEKIKWRKKIASFLKAKFFHKKYESSF